MNFDPVDVSSAQMAIRDAWRSFVEEKEVESSDVVPSYVFQGWQISRKYGVDPWGRQVPPVLGDEEFAKLCEEYADLLRCAEPMLQMLEVSIRGTGYIATLAVASGHLLEVVGDDELLGRACAQYNIPGAERSVRIVGTSALSLSISERRPLQITGYEHYNRFFHDWRCSAAPIFDANDTPIASLTLSCHLSRPDIHTLTLAKSCADGISLRLREYELMKAQRHLNAMLASVQNALPEAILALDPTGVITHANNKADLLLSRAGEDVVGKSLADIFSKPDLPKLRQFMKMGHQGMLEVEVLSAQGPSNRICRFAPILLDSGKSLGTIISMSTKSQVVDIAKHVGGNYAKYSFDDIKGESHSLKTQIDLAKKAAATTCRVLLYGESGTGKELFAQSIHNSSLCSQGPFVAISCAAIPRDLIESELFGYVGGAFTGARRNGMVGKMELASGGTLFLDEINSLPLEMQAKLLRALQQMEVVRIGDTKPTPIDVRVIAATNKDLREAVRQGFFREDLYFRLNVVEINIPPLRERHEDLAILAHTFLRRLSLEMSIPFLHIGADAMDAIYSYSWPGNVRELDNVCERALLVAEGGVITRAHLPAHIADNAGSACAAENAGGGKPPVRASSVDDAYKHLVEEALAECRGNISNTAEKLGIARTTLYRKIKKYGLSQYL